MIRTGNEYIESIRDGREVHINGEKVKDVPTHPMFKPIVDIRARIYDMQNESSFESLLTYEDNGEKYATSLKPPKTQNDWWQKRKITNTVFAEIGGVVTRVGDEAVGEMWSLFDGQDILNQVDPQFSENIKRHIDLVTYNDPFHVSANTDPKGDRSKHPKDQDPDMLLHVVKETDAGLVVRGAKFETAAAYANQAFTKPTIANWGNEAYSDYAVGFICDLSSPGIKMICRTGFAGESPAEDYPLGNKFDEVDSLVIFDNVLCTLGKCPVLQAYQGGHVYPGDLAQVFRLCFCPEKPSLYRSDDRCSPLQCPTDRIGQATGGTGKTGPYGCLP